MLSTFHPSSRVFQLLLHAAILFKASQKKVSGNHIKFNETENFFLFNQYAPWPLESSHCIRFVSPKKNILYEFSDETLRKVKR